MENALQVIKEQNVLGKDFKIYGTSEQPLFLAKDVAEMIEYDLNQVGKMIQSVDEDEKVFLNTRNIFTGNKGNPNKWFLTENGVYEVLFLSTKPIAKEFKKEVKKILHELRTGEKTIVKTETLKDFLHSNPAERMKNDFELPARIEGAKLLREIGAEYEGKSKTYKQILDAHATKLVTGEFLLPLPSVTRKTYSATEIGEIVGISAQKVGKITNDNGLKTEQFGEWIKDKSKYSAKEVETFRYYEDIIDELKKYIA